MSALVEITGLSKRYGDFDALTSLDMSVDRGEIVALLGPNGAGKTTAIRLLMGILEPTAGRATIDGRDCFRQRAEVMSVVGYVPDEPIFYDYLRGSEVIRFVGEMRGLSPGDTWNRAEPLVEELDLGDALEEYAVNYSKGMKKKLAVICALIHDPLLLILDEPTNGLDPFATRTFHSMVRTRADRGTSVFFSTHLLDQAERLSKRIGILSRGRLAALGEIDDLRKNLREGGTLEEIFFQVAAEEERKENGSPAEPARPREGGTPT
jgi:ABC-2 type transport system ATP-binding protein